jgi:hypothetical protein
MSDTGSKDKAVTAAPMPVNEGVAIGDMGWYEVAVDIKLNDCFQTQKQRIYSNIIIDYQIRPPNNCHTIPRISAQAFNVK